MRCILINFITMYHRECFTCSFADKHGKKLAGKFHDMEPIDSQSYPTYNIHMNNYSTQEIKCYSCMVISNKYYTRPEL